MYIKLMVPITPAQPHPLKESWTTYKILEYVTKQAAPAVIVYEGEYYAYRGTDQAAELLTSEDVLVTAVFAPIVRIYYMMKYDKPIAVDSAEVRWERGNGND